MPTYTGDYTKIEELRKSAAEANKQGALLTGASKTFGDRIKEGVRQHLAQQGTNALAEAVGTTTGQLVSEPANIRARMADVNPLDADAAAARQMAQSLGSLATLGEISTQRDNTIEGIIGASTNRLAEQAAIKKAEAEQANAEADNILELLRFKEEKEMNDFKKWYDTQNLKQKGGTGGMTPSQNIALYNALKPSATQEQLAVNAKSGLTAVNQLKTILGGKGGQKAKRMWKSGLLGRILGGKDTRQYADAAREAYDVFTRSRTGAALNMTEQQFYEQYIPIVGDDKETSNIKLKRLEELYQAEVALGYDPRELLAPLLGGEEDPSFIQD